MEKNEDLDICRECGGLCCKKCGCDYSVKDFKDLSYKGILKILSEGKISIVSAVDFQKLKNGKVVPVSFLYLRARNCNRDVVDLLSMKTRCSQLDSDGCLYTYENRPTGGCNLTPSREEDGPCLPIRSPLNIILEWKPYQNVLRKVVKNYTGKTVEEKLREDALCLFTDFYQRKFSGVSEAEVVELQTFIPNLAQAYPEENLKAAVRNTLKIYSKSKFQ